MCILNDIEHITNYEKLENIVIDYYSDSDESEQLRERQQTKLETLKQKRI